MKKIYAFTLVVALLLNFLLQPQGCMAQTCWSGVGAGMGVNPDSARSPVLNYSKAFANYNGNLVIGGFFNYAGAMPAADIAVWNGSSWSTLGTGFNWNN